MLSLVSSDFCTSLYSALNQTLLKLLASHWEVCSTKQDYTQCMFSTPCGFDQTTSL